MSNLNNPEIEVDEVQPKVSLITIGSGVDRAQSFMVHLIRNEKIKGEKKAFGPGLLKEIHRRVMFYYPPLAGQFRGDDETRIGGRQVAKAVELDDKVYLFERWLEMQVDAIRQDPEDLDGALRLAAASHHGVVTDLHPFSDGNGRVARVLTNGILVLNTREGFFFNIYITPVPILREQIDEKKIQKMLEDGKQPKLTPYIQAIENTNNTWSLNPLETYIASRWSQAIERFLIGFKGRYSRVSRREDWKDHLNQTERSIIDKIEERKGRLQQFIDDDINGRHQRHLVPDFFDPRKLHLNVA